MPRRGPRKPPRVVASEPGSLRAWAARHTEWALSKNYSERTIEGWSRNLGYFFSWAEARDVTRPQQVTRPILERYMRHLFHLRKPDGKPLSFPAQLGRITPIRAFFRWLTRQNVLLSNPASDLDMPRVEHRLPKAVLTANEAERVMLQPDVRTSLGLRDRAMLEVLYSTGMRRAELANLGVYHLDIDRGTLMVRHGKGRTPWIQFDINRHIYLIDPQDHSTVPDSDRDKIGSLRKRLFSVMSELAEKLEQFV